MTVQVHYIILRSDTGLSCFCKYSRINSLERRGRDFLPSALELGLLVQHYTPTIYYSFCCVPLQCNQRDDLTVVVVVVEVKESQR